MSVAGYTKTCQIKTTASTAYSVLPGNSATFNISGAMLDDTDFTSTGWTSRIRGLKDYSLNVTNIYKSTNAALNTMRDALLSGASLDVQYLPNGTKGFQGRVIVESYNLSGDVGGIEQVDVTANAEGTQLSTV